MRSESPRPRRARTALTICVGRGHADVRRNQRLFERLDGLDVNRLAAPRRLVSPLDDLLEPLDELFLRACQRLFDLVEKSHGSYL